MSCSGCRVLRKGCSDSCVLRPSISWIEGSEAQGHATVFVAKFFGRASLLSSLSSVPDAHRPALFRSLLYEACGRIVNPIAGVVGVLWSDNWDACEAAVDAVLHGGIPRLAMKHDSRTDVANGLYELKVPSERKRAASPSDDNLSLCLTRRASSPSDESVMTYEESGDDDQIRLKEQPKLLNLFF